MDIFNILAGGFLVVCIIRLVVIILNFNNSNTSDKVTRLLGVLISIVLASITWGIIYAFFGYDDTPRIEPPKKNSIIKFEDKNG